MKRTHRLTAVLLILCMGISVFSETALAKEPENTALEMSAKEAQALDEGEASGTKQAESGKDNGETAPQQVAGDSLTAAPEQETAGSGDSASESQDTDGAGKPAEEAKAGAEDGKAPEDTAVSADFDDPGRGRLSGTDIPEEFFGDGAAMRAASTGITHNRDRKSVV